MPYATTPPFVDPSDYGKPKRRFQPPWLQSQSGDMEEPEVQQTPPPTPLPVLSQTAPPRDSVYDSQSMAEGSLQKLQTLEAQRPRLERKGGFIGALQTVGDMFLNPAVAHPAYTRQMQDWQQDVQGAQNEAKVAVEFAKGNRDVARYDRDNQVAAAREGLYNKQAAKLDEPKPFELGPGQRRYAPDGTVIAENPAPLKPLSDRETPDQARSRREQEADSYGLKGRERTEYVLTGRIPRPQSQAAGESRAPANSFRVIEQTKNAQMLSAQKAAKRQEELLRQQFKAPGNLMSDEDFRIALDRIWADYNDQMATIQRGYLSTINAAGGSAPLPEAQPQKPAAPPAKPTQQSTPRPGTVEDGYRFKGGNPADPNNWEKVK